MFFDNKIGLNVNPLICPLQMDQLTKFNEIKLESQEKSNDLNQRHEQIAKQQQKEEEARINEMKKQMEINKRELERIQQKITSKNDIDCEQSQKQLLYLIIDQLKLRSYKTMFNPQQDVDNISQAFAEAALKIIVEKIKQQNIKRGQSEKMFDKTISIDTIRKQIGDIINGRQSLVQNGPTTRWKEISMKEIEDHMKQE